MAGLLREVREKNEALAKGSQRGILRQQQSQQIVEVVRSGNSRSQFH